MTELGRFTYCHTEFVVTAEPSRRTGEPTYRSRPAQGGAFPAHIEPRNYCKAFRRWRQRFEQQKKRGLI